MGGMGLSRLAERYGLPRSTVRCEGGSGDGQRDEGGGGGRSRTRPRAKFSKVSRLQLLDTREGTVPSYREQGCGKNHCIALCASTRNRIFAAARCSAKAAT